jgi:hypothetical protein
MLRVLPLTSPAGFAPRPVWGPRCRRLGAQVSVTRFGTCITPLAKRTVSRYGRL